MVKNISLRDITKLATLLLVISTTTYLGVAGILPGEAVAGIISACLGYVFGNGHGIVEKIKQCPDCGQRLLQQ